MLSIFRYPDGTKERMCKMNQKKYAIPAILGMLLTAIIWGFAFVVVKNSLDSINTEYMLALRFTVAVVALSLIFIKKFKKINLLYIRNGAILGAFLFISYAFQTYGCEQTTAGKNAFLTTIYVIIVPFLSWIINKKKPNKFCIIGAVLGIVGIALLSLGNEDVGNIFSVNIGDMLTIVCGVGYAVHFVFVERYNKEQDPVLLTVLQLAFAAIFSWILALINGGEFPRNIFETDVLISILYLGLMSTMLAFLLQNICQKYVAASTAALVLSFESVFGALFGVLVLSETLTPKMIVGCVLMFVAVVTVQTKFAFLSKMFKKKT